MNRRERAELRRARLADPLAQPEVRTILHALEGVRRDIQWSWWYADWFNHGVEVLRAFISDPSIRTAGEAIGKLGRMLMAVDEADKKYKAGGDPPPPVSGKRPRSWRWAVEVALIQIVHSGVVPPSVADLHLPIPSPRWSKDECRALILALRGLRSDPGSLREARKRADTPDAVDRTCDFVAQVMRYLGLPPDENGDREHVIAALRSQRCDPFHASFPTELVFACAVSCLRAAGDPRDRG